MIKGTFIVVLLPVILLALFSLVQHFRTVKLLSKRNNPNASKMNVDTTTLTRIITLSNSIAVLLTGLLAELILISGIVNTPDSFVTLLLHYLVILLIYTTIADFIFRIVSYIYAYIKIKGDRHG